MEEDNPSKISWGEFEYNSNDYQFEHKYFPIGSEGGWTSHTTREEESTVTTRAQCLKIIVVLGTVIVIVKIQLWCILFPYFPIQVCAITVYYIELYLIDHRELFMWQTNFPHYHVIGQPQNQFHSRGSLLSNLNRLEAARKINRKRPGDPKDQPKLPKHWPKASKKWIL